MKKKEYKQRIQSLKATVRSGPLQQRAPAQVERAQRMLDHHTAIKQAYKGGQITKDQKKEQRTAIFDKLDPKYNGAQRTDYLTY